VDAGLDIGVALSSARWVAVGFETQYSSREANPAGTRER